MSTWAVGEAWAQALEISASKTRPDAIVLLLMWLTPSLGHLGQSTLQGNRRRTHYRAGERAARMMAVASPWRAMYIHSERCFEGKFQGRLSSQSR